MSEEENDDFDSVLKEAVEKYKDRFENEPMYFGFAPGRVNLIGEHTDYNDGFVLPIALPLFTLVLGNINDTEICHVITTSEEADEPLDAIFDAPSSENTLSPGKPKWLNYVTGVVANFPKPVPGFNALVTSTVPVGGGLSSSAALEVATYSFLEALTGYHENSAAAMMEKVKACQKAEHEFANMPCGIMDQFVSFMAHENHALLIDCRSLDYTQVPIANPNVSILIADTNVSHELAGSEYSTRRKQCEEAAETLGKESLRDVTLEELQANEQRFMSEETYRRARHVVTEIKRTQQAVIALKEGDYKRFGVFMHNSHISLRDDFEVSCPELDETVQAAMNCDDVFGARMTGGGFGGCVVILCATEAVSDIVGNIAKNYSGSPTFYVCRAGKGAYNKEIPIVDHKMKPL